MFHNINILSSFVLTYILNCYSIPGRLFIEEEKELLSQEEKTEGDLLAMKIQSIPATLLLNLLIHLLQRKFTMSVAFANDVTSDGKIKYFRKWLELLSSYDPMFRYYPQQHSSWTIVKKARRLSAEKQFQDININITTVGKQHLGAVIRYEKN